MDDDPRVDIAGRTLIVSSFDAWDTLCNHAGKLILVADPSLDLSGDKGSRAVRAAQQKGHILITCNPTSPPNPEEILLPSPPWHELKEKLRAAGYSGGYAERLARRSNANLSSLLRLLQGVSSSPEWSNGPNAPSLAIAALLGSWSDSSNADRDVVSKVTGMDYPAWITKAREFAMTPEVPLVHQEGDWKFTLRYEGWLNLGSHLYDEHLDRILSAAVAVLSEKDPQFDLSPDKRYMAQVWKKVPSHSHALRKGISETLALIGSHPEVLESCSTGKPEYAVRQAVKQILYGTDWVRWASLGNLLPSLAEASPDEFLNAVEHGLRQNPSPFDELFLQEESGLFGRNYLSGLIWALEGLAWDNQYLLRVCAILGELAKRDPGGNWGNRTIESLKKILLPWLPQTAAPAERRRAAVRTLKRDSPEIAWELLSSLMPNQTESSMPTNRPFWRDAVPETWDGTVKIREYWNEVSDYAVMVVEMVEDEPARAGDLVELLDDLPNGVFDKALACLSSETVANLPEEHRNDLWTKLVILSRRHRAYPDADWALSDASVSQIESVAENLAPQERSSLHKMLFDEYDLHLYENTHDWRKVDEERSERRRTAVEDILDQGGLEEVILFAGEVEEPHAVGLALADIGDNTIDESLLPFRLEDEDEDLAAFIRGYVWRRRYMGGWEWVDGLDMSNWTASQIGRFLSCLPFSVDNWERVNSLLGSAEDEYWNAAVANPYNPDCDIGLAVEKLMSHGRPRAALMCLGKQALNEQQLNPDQAFAALNEWPSSSQESVRIDPYMVVRIFSALQDGPDTNRERLMEAEWVNLALFDDRRIGSPKALESGIATDPDLFCKIANIVYPLEVVEPSSDEERLMIEAQFRNAWKLLHHWKTVPGTQTDGTFKPEEFKEWLEEIKARHGAEEIMDLALLKIGQVLIHTPPDPDGLWIHHEVAKALNDVSSETMLEGFRLGMSNRRGAHFIDWTGAQEENLADAFTQKAEEVENQGYLRFAAELRRIAENYRLEARQVRARAQGMEGN